MAPYWSESFGNPHSIDYAVGWQADKAVREAAESVAALIGADADEIVFTSGATEANNLALLGAAPARGTQAYLGIRDRAQMRSCGRRLINGGGQQEGLRSGTLLVPLCFGMAAAADLARSPEASKERCRTERRRNSFVARLRRGQPSVALNGACDEGRHPGNANVRFDVPGIFLARFSPACGGHRRGMRLRHSRTVACPSRLEPRHPATRRFHSVQLRLLHYGRRHRNSGLIWS